MQDLNNTNKTPETQMVAQVYAGINSNDMDLTLMNFDPHIERVEPEGFPSSGTYRGLDAVRTHFSKARDTWAEGSCEMEKFLVVGDNIVAFVHVKVRLKDSKDWIEGRLADVFTFQSGKIIRMRTFGDISEALKWVGA